MKSRGNLVWLLLLGLVVSVLAMAASLVRVQVKVIPVGPPTKIYVDGTPGKETMTLAPGIHTLRVSRQSVALEREVVVKAGTPLILVADFTKNEIQVANQVSYSVFPGPTRIVFSPPNTEPPPTPPPTSAQKPAGAPAPPPPPPRSASTAQKPPPPATASAPQKQTSASTATPPGPPEKPGLTEENIEPELAPACPPKSQASACLTKYDRHTPRGALFAYYCLLTHHDFDRAYQLRLPAPDKDLKWFYEITRPFCAFHDFRLQGLTIKTTKDNKALATYTVDLLDAKGKVAETWKMKTSLVKNAGLWLIAQTAGEMIIPPPPASPTSSPK